jgi:hypothetical protein
MKLKATMLKKLSFLLAFSTLPIHAVHHKAPKTATSSFFVSREIKLLKRIKHLSKKQATGTFKRPQEELNHSMKKAETKLVNIYRRRMRALRGAISVSNPQHCSDSIKILEKALEKQRINSLLLIREG